VCAVFHHESSGDTHAARHLDLLCQMHAGACCFQIIAAESSRLNFNIAFMSDTEACSLCPQGCPTVDGTPNGVCPKFWQRPDGSSLCSQSWSCMPNASTNSRIIGSFFFLVTLIYVRIMYYNYKKNSNGPPGVALLEAGGLHQCFRRSVKLLTNPQAPEVLSVAYLRAYEKFLLAPLQGDTMSTWLLILPYYST
jgi:hypothetical protein